MLRWSITLALAVAAAHSPAGVAGLQPSLVAAGLQPFFVVAGLQPRPEGGPEGPPLQYVGAGLPPSLDASFASLRRTSQAGQSAVQEPRGQRPDLKRQTKKDDPVLPLDYEQYFPGTWSFEWRVPESPLGSAGTITGKEIYIAGKDGAYASVIEATGPDGAYTVRSTITYDQAGRLLTRRDRDSRGFEIAWRGPIGGDLGGFYNIHYESEPFTHKGHTIQLKMLMRLVSPLNFKVLAQIAVDGTEYTGFGNPWWQKRETR